MKEFALGISIAPKAERPFPAKEILWSGLENWQSRFPNSSEAWGRKQSSNPVPLHAFCKAVSEAQERVWIVDDYLLKFDSGSSAERIDQILEWLPFGLAASDIRFLTRRTQEVDENVRKIFQQRAQEINNHPARRGKLCSIEIKLHLSDRNCNFIHDRFAIVDDELWHFGATVGGLHASVSAASRGWRATDHGAIEFFEEIWNLGVRR
ncbi:MAG: hypothetical protein P4L77_13670 [Sulfuriferula sp.]|nr:hypothetical protein [Sulfuriferula sp.]